MKVVTVVGTRPEVIKLSRVIHELDQHTRQVLVHSGQNYDYQLNEVFFQQLGIRRPDHFLKAAGGSTAQTIGLVISRSDEVFALEKPDALLLLGDTNSCLCAISAKRRKIPIFHMEAGNRCFDDRVPEEINRRIVDHISDINLTYTEHARRYLLAEGLRPERIVKTGSPMKEVLEFHAARIEASAVLSELGLEAGQFFVASAHREENVDSEVNFGHLLATLSAVAERFELPIVVSTHPRTRKRLEETNQAALDPRIRFLEPLGFFEYVKLQKTAKCVLSDSGTLTEESSILDFPAVTLRQAHERPEGMDEGTLIMSGLEAPQVLKAIEVVMAHHVEAPRRTFSVVADYDTDTVSKKVLRIMLSYTDYVNRTVWRKTL
jgi:UDP-N-acetylglucosamine 2-epimerase (non-hydrolysing)